MLKGKFFEVPTDLSTPERANMLRQTIEENVPKELLQGCSPSDRFLMYELVLRFTDSVVEMLDEHLQRAEIVFHDPRTVDYMTPISLQALSLMAVTAIRAKAAEVLSRSELEAIRREFIRGGGTEEEFYALAEDVVKKRFFP